MSQWKDQGRLLSFKHVKTDDGLMRLGTLEHGSPASKNAS